MVHGALCVLGYLYAPVEAPDLRRLTCARNACRAECTDAIAKDGEHDEASPELAALASADAKVDQLQQEVTDLSKKMDRVLAALESTSVL